MIWFRYHWVELASVTAPTVAAVTVSPWWALLTVAAAGQWARHELAQAAPPPSPAREDRVSVDRSA